MEDAETATITVGSPVGYADDLWQIGSKRPPAVCLCCGLGFNDKRRMTKGPYLNGPYRYVCRVCWSLPYLFFPDKKLATCGECWIPPEAQRHIHVRATAPRGARIGREQEARRRRFNAGTNRSGTQRKTASKARTAKPRGKAPSKAPVHRNPKPRQRKGFRGSRNRRF